MLSLHPWRGDENVLDVGCGRGLLLAGAAKRIATLSGTGHATGIDVWSNVDMGGNSAAATQHNLDLEGISDYCTLLSQPAQEMSFPDATFDVIVSNLCLHNIYDPPTRRQALQQIVRVLKPGGIALISDYKLTAKYATRVSRCRSHRGKEARQPPDNLSATHRRHRAQTNVTLSLRLHPTMKYRRQSQ